MRVPVYTITQYQRTSRVKSNELGLDAPGKLYSIVIQFERYVGDDLTIDISTLALLTSLTR